MPLGAALTSLGGSLTVAYLIYSLQDSSRSFWRWPGILGVLIVSAGVLTLLAGFLITAEAEVPGRQARIRQKQRGGRRSTNYQAGGDITVGQYSRDKKNKKK
jgi:hypothetical protein